MGWVLCSSLNVYRITFLQFHPTKAKGGHIIKMDSYQIISISGSLVFFRFVVAFWLFYRYKPTRWSLNRKKEGMLWKHCHLTSSVFWTISWIKQLTFLSGYEHFFLQHQCLQGWKQPIQMCLKHNTNNWRLQHANPSANSFDFHGLLCAYMGIVQLSPPHLLKKAAHTVQNPGRLRRHIHPYMDNTHNAEGRDEVPIQRVREL